MIVVLFQFMIPKDGNSGVYLQGRYEVAFLDSHGKAEDALFGKRYSSYDREFENRHGQRGYGSGAAHYTTTFTLERGQPSVSADHFENGRLFDVARWRIPPPSGMPWSCGSGRGAWMASATLHA